MKIRIKFSKKGNMKFIGHLDVMRYFQKVMRRAEVDIAYTEGFSPHQKMSFAAPLGVGLTSDGEYVDIEVNSTDSSEDMVKRLNSVMVEGMSVISYKELGENSENAMSCVAAADYTLAYREKYMPNMTMAEIADKLSEFYAKNEILIIKKTKKSEMEVDIKPMIYKIGVNGSEIFMQLATGSSANLKPELVMEAFYRYLELPLHEFTFMVNRVEVYTNIGDDENINLVTLENMGDDIAI